MRLYRINDYLKLNSSESFYDRNDPKEMSELG